VFSKFIVDELQMSETDVKGFLHDLLKAQLAAAPLIKTQIDAQPVAPVSVAPAPAASAPVASVPAVAAAPVARVAHAVVAAPAAVAPAEASAAALEATPAAAAEATVPDQAAPEMPDAMGAEVEVPDAIGAEVSSSAAAEEAALMANATEQAKLDLAAISASASGAGNLRGASGWGHGIFGETCCMCSKRVGFLTVLYAAADYSNFYGGHAANYWCQQSCEIKCHFRGGHMFGCYDERLLLQMDQQYGHRAGFQILHDRTFGNIC